MGADAVVGGSVGIQQLSDGADIPLRLDRQAALVVSELNGRFAELAYRGQLNMAGMALTAINAATFTSATTGVTATPIAGIFNPQNSGVNAFLLLAQLGVTMTALQATGGGPYVWMANPAAGPISTGAQPFNAKTLAAAGSQIKNVSGLALTGMTGALAIMRGSSLFGGSHGFAFLATAVAQQTQQNSAEERIEGGIIVPPGAVVALMATTTPVAHSAASGLVWAELPV